MAGRKPTYFVVQARGKASKLMSKRAAAQLAVELGPGARVYQRVDGRDVVVAEYGRHPRAFGGVPAYGTYLRWAYSHRH